MLNLFISKVIFKVIKFIYFKFIYKKYLLLNIKLIICINMVLRYSHTKYLKYNKVSFFIKILGIILLFFLTKEQVFLPEIYLDNMLNQNSIIINIC